MNAKSPVSTMEPNHFSIVQYVIQVKGFKAPSALMGPSARFFLAWEGRRGYFIGPVRSAD